jgi:YHS domain-containing protein
MKNLLYVLLLVIIGTTLIMCGGEQKSEVKEEATEEAASTTVADTLMAQCEGGCGMTVEKAKMVTHEVDGEKHYFCSEMCKENYLASKQEEKK